MADKEFGNRNGHLDLQDWDKAVALHIGAVLDTHKNRYYLPVGPIYVDNNRIDKALIMYKRPEPTQSEFDLPMISLSRDDISAADERLYTIAQQYRIPAEGSTRVSAMGQLGYTSYEQKEQERPYDLLYTVEVWSRYKSVAQMLLLMMMTKFPLKGSIAVEDSVGCVRTYAAYQEGTSDLTEVLSLVDRISGFSLSVRLEAELTLDRMSAVYPAFYRREISSTPIRDGDPDPGAGGIYADGEVDITIDVIED